MRSALGFLVGAVVVLAIAATGASAAEKFAYINSDQVRAEYQGVKDIESQLGASLSDWKGQARDMETAIDVALKELDNQKLLLSPEAAKEKETAIQGKQAEYERFVNDVWGSGGLAAKRELELWQPVFDRINAILKDLGTQGGYTMIFDAAQGGIVYAAPTTDITQEVIDKLNGTTE